jgi:hypothetical protein
MFRPASIIALSAIAIGLSGCAKTASEAKTRAPAATIVGKPVECIQMTRIDNLRYYDDYTIDFVMKNGQIYRNTLPYRCPELGFEQRITYKSTINQLCRTDTFTILHTDGTRGATCGFGQFVPIKLDKAKGS